MNISVIIPVYNAENYIERCVTSIIEYVPNSEIIVVNDGSTDKSLEILFSLKEKFGDSIKIIDKENGGVSSARNEGIKQATGGYVMFVDADDYLVDRISIDTDSGLNRDIYVFNYIDVDSEGKCLAKHNLVSKIACLNDLIEQYVLSYDYNPCWGKLYRRELVLDIPFPMDMKIGEDAVWFGETLRKISSVGIIDSYAYAYLQNSNGAMNIMRSVIDAQRIDEFEREIILKKSFITKWNDEKKAEFLTLFANNIVAKVNFVIKGCKNLEQLEQSESALIENSVINKIMQDSVINRLVPLKRRFTCFLLLRKRGRKIYNLMHFKEK